MHPIVRVAKEAVEAYVREGRVIQPPRDLPPEVCHRAGVFVSIKKGGKLRGCIGTIEPLTDSVPTEVIRNAIAAATEDHRFPPVTEQELGELQYSVDVLCRPEPVSSLEELDARRYGVIVQKGLRRGLLLPDLEGVESPQEQLYIAKLKAGIPPEDEDVQVFRFEVRRFH
jgi:AmmeMemoRadiSam system protein A